MIQRQEKILTLTLVILIVCAANLSTLNAASATEIPHLEKRGEWARLIVDDKPFLARAGELGNSVASNLEHLNIYWDKFRALNMNTLVAPVYWDLTEPEEGRFDFSRVDGMIKSAQKHNMKLVLLWFGSWKNSMSSYAPEWVKVDYERFPRVRDRDGRAFEILSPFAEANYTADAKAFLALMDHIRKRDSKKTVIMVQPENEIGMVELARSYGEEANRLYKSAVPTRLMDYLSTHRQSLTPEVLDAWRISQFKSSGTWVELFGDSPQTEELFMAWHFARYTEEVAKAGKAAYPLPMFVNAALIRPGYQPGQYVSAGPLPHLIDIWRAAAPSIDFISPDIYFPNFTEWTERYTRSGNPLFIPEALRNESASVNALYAAGEHQALGFSPFGIEAISGPAEAYLAKSYDILRQLEPLLSSIRKQGQSRGLLQISDQQRAPQQIRFGAYEMHVAFEYATPPPLADGVINESHDVSRGPKVPAGGLVIQMSENEYIFAGIGLTITFDSLTPNEQAGIVSAETGYFDDGKWTPTQWNNGDQTHQGRHVRLVPGEFSIQKVKLYRYR